MLRAPPPPPPKMLTAANSFWLGWSGLVIIHCRLFSLPKIHLLKTAGFQKSIFKFILTLYFTNNNNKELNNKSPCSSWLYRGCCIIIALNLPFETLIVRFSKRTLFTLNSFKNSQHDSIKLFFKLNLTKCNYSKKTKNKRSQLLFLYLHFCLRPNGLKNSWNVSLIYNNKLCKKRKVFNKTLLCLSSKQCTFICYLFLSWFQCL